MPTVALGVAFVVFGLASLQDGHRILTTMRARSTFDFVGPDYYLLIIGALLIVMGAFLIVPALTQLRHQSAAAGAAGQAEPDISEAEQEPKEFSARHLWLFGALCIYVLAIPYLGYALASFMMFAVLFWIMGVESWIKSTVASAVMTVAFVATFRYLADMPFPTGFLHLG